MSNKQFEKKWKEDDQGLARIFFTEHTECGEQRKFRESFAKFAVRLYRNFATKFAVKLNESLV